MSEGFNHFKFMYQRFMTSTLGWKEEEQGAYLRLLVVQFDQGGIPADLEGIGAISSVAKKIWAKKLRHKFRFTNEDGTLYNKVMKGVRDEAIEKQAINKENGGKGGRPPKNRTVILNKPDGSENDNPNESETKPIPVTSNQEPVYTPEVGECNTRPDLSKSNLYRQPSVPSYDLVKSVFIGQGGTEEMAKKFFDNNEATSWFLKGSPITNFVSLVPGFIANWNTNLKKDKTAAASQSIADGITAARLKAQQG